MKLKIYSFKIGIISWIKLELFLIRIVSRSSDLKVIPSSFSLRWIVSTKFLISSYVDKEHLQKSSLFADQSKNKIDLYLTIQRLKYIKKTNIPLHMGFTVFRDIFYKNMNVIILMVNKHKAYHSESLRINTEQR